jgi:lysophospholipase L1-like esterase
MASDNNNGRTVNAIEKQGDNLSRWVKIVVVNTFLIGFILVCLEILATRIYPEFKDAYFTESITRGNPVHLHTLWGHRVDVEQVNDKLERSADDSRILFIGDSITYGYGISYDDTYHRKATRLLEERGCNVVVHGLGRLHSNLGTLMASDRKFIIEDFDADLVVYQFNVNDVVLSHAPRKRHTGELTLKERFEKFRISYLNRSTLLKTVQAMAMRQYQKGKSAGLVDTMLYAPGEDEASYRLAWDLFASTLVQVKQELESRGIDFVVVTIPESYRISNLGIDNDFSVNPAGITVWPGEKAGKLAVDMGMPAWDSTAAMQQFRQQHQDVPLFFPNDANHPNRAGHEVIGSYLADMIVSHGDICS